MNVVAMNRRDLIDGAFSAVSSMALATSTCDAACAAERQARPVDVTLTVNGQLRTILVEPRTTLLDALRGQVGLTGTKKGCDRGECGACTVLVSCMILAAMQEGKRITTTEGLEYEGKLHPVQEDFIEHDGFQCGFCTSG